MAGKAKQNTKKPAKPSRYFVNLFIPPKGAPSESIVLAEDDMVVVPEIGKRTKHTKMDLLTNTDLFARWLCFKTFTIWPSEEESRN
jgi:hypothetical protein